MMVNVPSDGATLRVMAELDYAFLAEYAAVLDGKLTAVGASYTHLTATSLPIQHVLYVAGRIRLTLGEEDSVALGVKVRAPDDMFTLSLEGELSHDDAARPYDGKVGMLWAVSVPMPLPKEGLYEVLVEVNGEQARRLAFDVAVQSPDA